MDDLLLAPPPPHVEGLSRAQLSAIRSRKLGWSGRSRRVDTGDRGRSYTGMTAREAARIREVAARGALARALYEHDPQLARKFGIDLDYPAGG